MGTCRRSARCRSRSSGRARRGPLGAEAKTGVRAGYLARKIGFSVLDPRLVTSPESHPLARPVLAARRRAAFRRLPYMARREDSRKSGHSEKIVEFTGYYEGAWRLSGTGPLARCAHMLYVTQMLRRDLALTGATPCRPASVPVTGPLGNCQNASNYRSHRGLRTPNRHGGSPHPRR